MRFLILVLLILPATIGDLRAQAGPLSSAGQEQLRAAEDTLGLLAFTMLRDSLEDNRYLACRAFIPRLVESLKTENSFRYPFERLSYLSIQYPPDSSFRIFTWQLFLNRNEYRYYGAIQYNHSELRLDPLIDRSEGMRPRELERRQLTPDNWYGMVVYDIIPVEHKSGNYYLLFGLDAFEAYRRRKIVDVLHFEPTTGAARFGKPVFVESPSYEGGPSQTRARLVQEYSAASYATLKYDPELELIMQENLVPIAGPQGVGPVNVPDGSYVGYELRKDGRWHSISKVYNHVYEEAPRTPRPAGTEEKKDLLGRRKQ